MFADTMTVYHHVPSLWPFSFASSPHQPNYYVACKKENEFSRRETDGTQNNAKQNETEKGPCIHKILNDILFVY